MEDEVVDQKYFFLYLSSLYSSLICFYHVIEARVIYIKNGYLFTKCVGVLLTQMLVLAILINHRFFCSILQPPILKFS